MGYLWQGAKGQLAIYNHERPVDEVIADPLTQPRVKKQLQRLKVMKAFVEKELAVKATSNYTTYVDLKRPFVVWVVSASPPFELKAHTWSFPIAGTVPYLGFFSEEGARSRAKDMEKDGFDTLVRGATAYSTLGWLRDPLLSSMLSDDEGEMANLLFHETTHDQVYIGGQSGFNEGAASFIGEYGERLYLERTHGATSPQVKAWAEHREKRRRHALEVKAFAQSLQRYYAESASLSEPERRAGKEKRFQDFGRGFKNNAALAAYLTYEDDQDVFDGVYEKCKGSLRGSLKYLAKFSEQFENLARTNSGSSPQMLLRNWGEFCKATDN
jgi:predicted aminopeptidase